MSERVLIGGLVLVVALLALAFGLGGLVRLPAEATAMKSGSIIWRRTFPDSPPGTDGVAIFEGRTIGRVREQGRGERRDPSHPKPWLWSVTDIQLAGRPGWSNASGKADSRRQAMARLIER